MYQINPEIITPLPFFPSSGQSKSFSSEKSCPSSSVIISDSRYTVKIAEKQEEITELLRLRYRIFKIELGKQKSDPSGVEKDEFDLTSHHLIALENASGRVIGGYRLRTTDLNDRNTGFYSGGEFHLQDLPSELLTQSVEIGRACIEASHRNGKVLFLLWKGIAQYLLEMKKRYIFGCCSLFSQNFSDGVRAFNQLERGGFLHDKIRVAPLKSSFSNEAHFNPGEFNQEIELPKLFNTYLRIGAKVCSPPVVDAEFGTIDFFVIFDSLRINKKYRRMFFS